MSRKALIIIIAVLLVGLIIGLGAMTPTTRPTETSSPIEKTTTTFISTISTSASRQCDPSYPDVCIPPPPPKLSCREIEEKYGYSNFKVLPPDPMASTKTETE
ncbi:MAG: hypothetical protein QXK84_07335 [Nitrososphaerota archaeon]